MGKYSIDISDTAKKHLSALKKSGDTASIGKVDKMVAELTKDPYTGTGKPEALKYKYQGYWSRRINKKDRIIYEVDESSFLVTIVSARGYYLDK